MCSEEKLQAVGTDAQPRDGVIESLKDQHGALENLTLQ